MAFPLCVYFHGSSDLKNVWNSYHKTHTGMAFLPCVLFDEPLKIVISWKLFLQNSHWNGLPLCVLFYGSSEIKNVCSSSHSTHIYMAFPLYVSFHAFYDCLKLFSQNSHWNGLSTVCLILSCLFKWDIYLKLFSQSTHLNGLSPVCVLSWIFRDKECLKLFSQTSHWNCLSLVCVIWCTFKDCDWLKLF